MRFVMLLGLIGCAPSVDLAVDAEQDLFSELPTDQAGPVAGWASLGAGYIVTGTTATVWAWGLPAGTPMTLIASANVAGPGLCPNVIAPDCVDIAGPIRTLTTAVADGSGIAAFTFTVPANVPGQIELLAYGRNGGFWVTNGAVSSTYQYGGDADADGLSNGDEYSVYGTDLMFSDTDGGSVSDGMEVANGTNPLDWSDDVPSACSGYAYDAGNGTGCWYTAPSVGMTCDDVCSTHGGFDAVTSQHAGNALGMYFWPAKAFGGDWVEVECSSTDNNTNWGANGGIPSGAWSHAACHVNCSCFN